MYVVKRGSKKEPVKFDKITARIIKMCYGLDPLVSPEAVAMKVIEGIYDGVSTSDLDNLAAEVAAAKTIDHPDYALLASRIAVSNLHKETKKTFDCPVCYESIKSGDEFTSPCNHVVCNECAKRCKNTCPMCRQDLCCILEDAPIERPAEA